MERLQDAFDKKGYIMFRFFQELINDGYRLLGQDKVDWYEIYGCGLENIVPIDVLKIICYKCDVPYDILNLLSCCKTWRYCGLFCEMELWCISYRETMNWAKRLEALKKSTRRIDKYSKSLGHLTETL